MSKYFKNVASFEDLKKQYNDLAKKNHPDNGGNLETMQEINIDFDALFAIWKNRHETQTGEKVTETAASTRKHFYTVNGWEGSNYNPRLTLKEIAAIVRAYCKEKYPTCKFSVRTHYASMCQELTVSIKEFPAPMYKTGDDLRREGLWTTETYTNANGETHEYRHYKNEVDYMLKTLRANFLFTANSWDDEMLIDAYEKAIERGKFYAIKTDYFSSVIDDINALVKSYNYDDSDIMTDYFDVNFYYFGCGFSDCVQVEKVARVADKATKTPATTKQPKQEDKREMEEVKEIETNETANNADFDRFAALAKAYTTGKTAPKQTEEPKQEEPEEEPAPVDETPEEPPEIGYNTPSDMLTTEEINNLLERGQIVINRDRWTHYTLFTAEQREGVKFLYSIHMYNDEETIEAGKNADFCGVIVNGNLYNNKSAIGDKLQEDVNRRLIEKVPDEATAEKLIENAEQCQLTDIERYKEIDWTQKAQNAFYKNEPPKLYLYNRYNDSFDWETVIDYLLNAEQTIENLANDYIKARPTDIYKEYLQHNGTTAIYERIKADKDNDEHKLLKIRNSIHDEKTVRVELTNGFEVKVESHAVKNMTYGGYITSWYVAASDRKYLNKNEYGHEDDIRLNDIVAIKHGGRILYKAA